jgi:hypothetical protein
LRLSVSALFAAAIAASSCSVRTGDVSFEVKGTEYRVPRGQVLSASSEPHHHIVIKPDGRSFELIYDSRAAGRVDRFGWPVIIPVSPDIGDLERVTNSGLKVVCRRGPEPWGGCGFSIRHGGATWSVRFPYGARDQAGEIRDAAVAALDTYRRAAPRNSV